MNSSSIVAASDSGVDNDVATVLNCCTYRTVYVLGSHLDRVDPAACRRAGFNTHSAGRDAVIEQARSLTHDDGRDEEAVDIDESCLVKGLRELNTSVHLQFAVCVLVF